MSERVVITSGRLSATIDPLGAELVSLVHAGGAELMTDADPAYWTGHAPILFPIVGALAGGRYRLDGREYQMPRHGFARRSAFAVSEVDERRAVFTLRATPATRASYPFDFRLRVIFEVDGATLAVTADVHNPEGQGDLPASIGFHPAFAWPLPYGRDRAAHRIVFAADEPAPLRRLDAAGLVDPAPRPSPLRGRTLALDDALFADDALIWDQLRSTSVRYGAEGGPRLDIAFDGAPMLGIWSSPVLQGAERAGARFVCIEPWHGIADPQGYAGDFRDKPGVFTVPPGDSRRIGMTVTLES